MHVQSVQKYCFSLSNMQICGVFIAVVAVVLKLPNIPKSRIRYDVLLDPEEVENY